MIPPPPSSTLFPYTTLFRSRLPGPRRHRAPRAGRGPGVALARALGQPLGALRMPLDHAARGEVRLPDRKSTRLNSSHVEISYAVFCLKKKKRTENGLDIREH